MTVLYYYAKINENNVCYGFETLPKKFKEEDMPSNLVYLIDYNESLLWKKYDRNLKAFSQESYEPSIDTILQEKIEELEVENTQLKSQVSELNATITVLNGSIMELTALISALQAGGAE